MKEVIYWEARWKPSEQPASVTRFVVLAQAPTTLGEQWQVLKALDGYSRGTIYYVHGTSWSRLEE